MWPPPTSFALLALSGIASAMVIDGIPQHAHLKRQRTTAHPLVADSMSATTKGTSLALDQTPNRYVADITINDRQFRVVIDTGSTDLWVKTSADFAYNTTDATPLSLVYGDTATGAINGTTGFAAVSLGGYTVPQQAFMNATAGAFDGLLDVGLDGYLGLGFISESEINEVFPSDSTVGQPLLYNIFDMTPEQENFISFSLSRSDDLEGSAAARFTINELDETYAAVANEPKVPIFPENTVVWGVPVDGISIDGVNITLKSIVPGAPNGSLIAIMDTGTPGASLPPDILYALYSRIPGASVSVGDSEILFVIPCNTSSVVTVVVSGVPYPIHPLDLSEVLHINTDIISNSTAHANVTLCRGSIHASAPEQFQVADALFGDFFQRNVYTVMNYGGRAAKSVTGSASIQMLALTDPTKAVADVLNVRMAQLALVPEFHDLVDGFVPALPGSTLADVRGAGSIGNASAAGAVGAVADGGAAPSSDGSAVQKYALIVIGMLSGNLLLLILLALVVGLYIKRGRKSSSRASAYAPVKLREEEMLQGETYEVDHRYSD
ncbi:aspartic peptidase domain-containing protein [Mycena belliarum]|uniref:Aspartic peptidase domain-containing protein n=1 Tax=Mycena belliarum TaxID=1033014 RepID=A0AAD6XMU5_9AGAR|nr:aspartic peptidase domain-containing protein [Mycena belliae]